jgi:bacterioferritin-associated ferredoxin
MYICICFAVTAQEIGSEIAAGARTVEEVGDRCGAGTGCGTCTEKIGLLLGPFRPRGETVRTEAAA